MSTIYPTIAVDRSMANVLLREEPEDEEEDEDEKTHDEEEDEDENDEDENEEDGDGYLVNAVVLSRSVQADFEGRRNSITFATSQSLQSCFF